MNELQTKYELEKKIRELERVKRQLTPEQISKTEKEMRESIGILSDFSDEQARELGKMIQGRPLYIIGMGSSLLFPARNAKQRAETLLKEYGKIFIGYPNGFCADYFKKDDFVFLNSNSGKTKEILDLADALESKGIEFYGVTAQKDSSLAKKCKGNFYTLEGHFEEVVAATKSIIQQALFFDAMVYGYAGLEFPLNKGKRKNKRVASYMDANLNSEISDDLIIAGLLAEHYFWIDHNKGVAEELSLKSAEICGKLGIYQQGTQVLHGIGESFKEDDLVFMVDPESYKEDDRESYREKDEEHLCSLVKKTRAKLVSVGHIGSYSLDNVLTLNAQFEEDFEAYSILTEGWNFLMKVAYAENTDPDVTKVAQKHRSR